MAERAYLNVHLCGSDNGGFFPKKADIRDKPAWCLGAESRGCLWVTVYEVEAASFAEARSRIEFVLDRGDLRQIPALVLLKRLVEETTGRRIGDGTIAELTPPGSEARKKLLDVWDPVGF